MKLIFVRHGRTIANDKGVFESESENEGELSKEGEAQIKKVALRLKDEKIDFIYSSPIKRAADSAKEIAKFHPQAHFIFTDELKEGCVKGFEGRPYSSIQDWNNPPKGVESIESMNKRAKKFIEDIYKKHKNETILIAGHNAINKSFIHLITGKKREEIHQDNTAISIFEIGEDKSHKIHCLNCTKHLD